MIEGRGLRKRHGAQTVLEGANISVGPGEHVVLAGDNGSGKTTLLHLLVGLRRPDAGEVCWKGTVLTGTKARVWRRARESWGFLPQDPRFPESASVRAVLRHHARIRAADAATAFAWVDRVGLGSAAEKRVDELSGGMRQRLGIALTLFHEPELIVMDEPMTSLDRGWREAFPEWLKEATGRGAAVLVTTQHPDSVDTGVIHMRCVKGRVTADGQPAEGAP